MNIAVKSLPKGLVEISVEMTPDEVKKELNEAAAQLTKDHPLSGFRPGMAPYDVVKGRFGEMAIYEQAMETIVRRTYVKTVMEHKLQVFGEPNVNVTKLVPGNPICYVATVAVVPKVTKLGDFRTISVNSKDPVIEDKAVEDALKELQRMRTKEVRAAREVQPSDKVVVDMDLIIDKVPVEGGQARNHGIYLDEEYYIPGLKDQVIGLKEGEKKTFTLPFPKDHYQKNLAGKNVDFELTMKEIYQLEHPPIDDAFAKEHGQDTIQKLREIIKKNMLDEAQTKERQRAEIEILEKIVEKSTFEDIPEAILNAEIERMLNELRHGLAERGVEFESYLKNIKKSLEDLKKEFAVQATKRINTTLVMRDLAEKEKIEASDVDLLEETQKMINEYSHDAASQEKIRSEEYQDYLRGMLRNKKVLELLITTSAKK